jgi:hypothetical protein
LLTCMGTVQCRGIFSREQAQVANSRIYRQRNAQLFRAFAKEGDQGKAEVDTAVLRNGDRISGEIEAIADDFLSLRSRLLPESVKVPLKNVQKLLFKDRERPASEWKAKAVFVNGDSLSIGVEGYDGDKVLAKATFSDQIRIEEAHLAGIVFRREPRVIYRANFENGDVCGFKSIRGEWDVADGKLGSPSGSSSRGSPSEFAVSLKLPQKGHLKYSWVVGAENRPIGCARFLFFAQAPDHYNPRYCYEVRISGNSIYLYVTIENNMQYLARLALDSGNRWVRMEVDYDSESGALRLEADGKEVLAGMFSSPISRGDYVLWSAEGCERFDDLVVEQMADAVLPPANEEEADDSVLLTNGDRLSGKIVSVSEGKVQLETGYSGEGLEVPVDDVSAVRFGKAAKENEEELPAISFRNGDRLSGRVICLERSSLRLGSAYLGEVEIDAAEVASVDFPCGDALPGEKREREAIEHLLLGPDSRPVRVFSR